MLNKRHYDPASLVLLSINVFFVAFFLVAYFINDLFTLGLTSTILIYVILLINFIYFIILTLAFWNIPLNSRKNYVYFFILNLFLITALFFINVQLKRDYYYKLYFPDLRNISEKIQSFTRDTGSLPDHETWCDDLLNWWILKGKLEYDLKKYFDRPSNNQCCSCYAMNENVRYSSPGDVVLLFQSHEGWNGHGGREAMAFDFHHNGKCIVLFNNGIIEGYTEEEAEKLLWE